MVDKFTLIPVCSKAYFIQPNVIKFVGDGRWMIKFVGDGRWMIKFVGDGRWMVFFRYSGFLHP
jgi:hypothetical protein